MASSHSLFTIIKSIFSWNYVFPYYYELLEIQRGGTQFMGWIVHGLPRPINRSLKLPYMYLSCVVIESRYGCKSS